MSVDAYLLCTCALMHTEHQHYLLYIYECQTYLVHIYVCMSMYGMYGMCGIMGGAYMYRYTHIAPIPDDARDLTMKPAKTIAAEIRRSSAR